MDKFPVYILGLRNRYRGKNLEEALKSYGIGYEIYWGIDGTVSSDSNHIPKGINLVSRFLSRPNMSIGELCCAQGHLNIYRKFIETGADWALVFEDDAVLTSDPHSVIEDLDRFPNSSLLTLHSLSIGSEIRIKGLGIKDIHNFTRNLEPHVTATGYLISRKAAIRTIKRVTSGQITSRADWPIEMFPGIAFFHSNTPIVFHNPAEDLSTIGDRLPENSSEFGYQLLMHRIFRFFRQTLANCLPKKT